jgi:LysR family transcriptional regulator for metE and metH
MDLRHLKLVQEVAREGTLTGATKRLFLTQSALSHQLAELERQAGTPVFARVAKRMVLTEAGRRILEVAGKTLSEIEQLDSDLRGIARGELGHIRLTTKCNTAYHWLPSVLPTFRRSHPGVEFTIMPGCSHNAMASVIDGDVDIALTYEAPDLELVNAEPLFQDEQVLIVAPDHPLAGKKHVNAADFAGLDLLLYTNEPYSSIIFTRVLNPAVVIPRRVSEVPITEGIVALVSAGVGSAVVTRWSVAPDIRAGRVVPVRITEVGLRRQWNALTLKQRAKPQYLVDFIALLVHGPNWIFDERSQQKNRRYAGLQDAPAYLPMR